MMLDPRMTKLAEVLINYSTSLKPGEKILIEAIDIPHEMTCELVRGRREVIRWSRSRATACKGRC